MCRAALDAARDAATVVVVIELTGRQPLLDLASTRRFALVARIAEIPAPSAAHKGNSNARKHGGRSARAMAAARYLKEIARLVRE